MLFNSATYLFTNYNHRAVGLLPNSSRIFSTIQHECWRGGTWHGGHPQGFDEGFETQEREREKNKKSAKLFMEFLHSSMDHPVSQRCKKPKSQPQRRHGGRRRADEVGVSEGDPAFDEVMIHA